MEKNRKSPGTGTGTFLLAWSAILGHRFFLSGVVMIFQPRDQGNVPLEQCFSTWDPRPSSSLWSLLEMQIIGLCLT